jgi:hypothetical protein
MEHVRELRKHIFCDDKLIMRMKEIGVNNNWDLAYLTTCITLILDTPNPMDVYEYTMKLEGSVLDHYDEITRLAAESGIDPAEFNIDPTSIESIRSALRSATDDDLRRITEQYEANKNQKRGRR